MLSFFAITTASHDTSRIARSDQDDADPQRGTLGHGPQQSWIYFRSHRCWCLQSQNGMVERPNKVRLLAISFAAALSTPLVCLRNSGPMRSYIPWWSTTICTILASKGSPTLIREVVIEDKVELSKPECITCRLLQNSQGSPPSSWFLPVPKERAQYGMPPALQNSHTLSYGTCASLCKERADSYNSNPESKYFATQWICTMLVEGLLLRRDNGRC